MKRDKVSNIIILTILFLACIAFLYPIGVLIYTSAQPGIRSANLGNSAILMNYKIVLSDKRLPRFFLNTAIITTSVTTLTLFVSSLAGFALSRLKFKFRETIMSVLLMGITMPAAVIIIPIFLLMTKLNLTTSVLSVIIIETCLNEAFCIFILRNFMINIPKSITEAAFIDGCNNWQTYYKIVLPLTRPALTAVGLFVFLWSWNDYFVPLIFLRKPELQTVQLAPQYYIGLYTTDIPLYFASMIIIILPVVIVYFCFQNQFIEGLTVGALKE